MMPTDTRTRHTPGPWKVMWNWREKLAVVGPANDGERTDSDRICNLPTRKNGEGKYNARLIAAAPEMAALLARICNYYGARDRMPQATLHQDLRNARALLARIDGEQEP